MIATHMLHHGLKEMSATQMKQMWRKRLYPLRVPRFSMTSPGTMVMSTWVKIQNFHMVSS